MKLIRHLGLRKSNVLLLLALSALILAITTLLTICPADHEDAAPEGDALPTRVSGVEAHRRLMDEHPLVAPVRNAVTDATEGGPSRASSEAGFLVLGRTVDRMLNPIPFVSLVVKTNYADAKSAISDSQGIFSLPLDNLSIDERVNIQIAGGSSDVAVIPMDVSIVCSATAMIELLVYCSLENVVIKGQLLFASGDPVAGGHIRAGLGPVRVADQQGMFEISAGAWGGSISLSFGIGQSGMFSNDSARIQLTKDQIESGVLEGLELRIPNVDCDGIVLVTDSDGRGIEGAEVVSTSGRTGQRTLTNAEGIAEIWFSKKNATGLWVRKKNFAERSASLLGVDCGGTLALVLPPEYACRGRVVDNLGKGIPGATIEIGPAHWGGFAGGQWTIAGQDGRFSFRVAGNVTDYTLVAKTKDGLVGRAYFRWASSQGRQTLIEVEQRCMVTGLVVDEDGNPVPDASVSSWRNEVVDNAFPSAATDHLGTFRLPVEETGTYTVSASKAGYSRGVGSAECGDQIVIRLDRPCYVSGRVLTKAGEPLSQFSVRVLGERPGGGTIGPLTTWTTIVHSETFVVDADALRVGDQCFVEIRSVVPGEDTLRVAATASREANFELDITL